MEATYMQTQTGAGTTTDTPSDSQPDTSGSQIGRWDAAPRA
jgi:hypothetical protein